MYSYLFNVIGVFGKGGGVRERCKKGVAMRILHRESKLDPLNVKKKRVTCKRSFF